MIKLCVEDYCHNCPYFEVTSKVHAVEMFGYNPMTNQKENFIERNYFVYCVNAEKCKAIEHHINKTKGGIDHD